MSPLLVALDLPLRTGDRAFTFLAQAGEPGLPGTGVIVPFGRRLMPGIVLGAGEEREGLRPIVAVVEDPPFIPPSVVGLAEWTAREYVSSVGEALSVATPWQWLWSGVRLHCRAAGLERLSVQARDAAAVLSRRAYTLTRVARPLAGMTDAAIELARSGALTATIAPPAPARTVADAPECSSAGPPLSAIEPRARAAAQRVGAAVSDAMAAGPRAVLVAGWDRTPGYLAAARTALAEGWSCVAMFASTDAAVGFSRAAWAAGFRPVLLHGDLAGRDRVAVWRAVRDARATLVVGTRGVVFAPVADPVLAIVDDEDHPGHKEERAPRYTTRAVAGARTRHQGVLVIGAATPSTVTYAGVQAGRLRLVAVPSPRPQIGAIDLRRREDPDAPISGPLRDAVRRAVRSGGRVLLLADRKGYAGGLHCAECGAVERCPQCGVAMPYARRARLLSCRFCGRPLPAPHVCSRCGGARLHALGAGTERLAAALRRVVPRVWQFDAGLPGVDRDPISALSPYRTLGGVLVATTFVLPWLEWLSPRLVGVVAADRWLHRPEFRAAERALALFRTLSMATKTRVLVETSDPAHAAIRAVQSPSLRPFYEEEEQTRRSLGYPPYRSLIAVTVSARTAAAAEAALTAFLRPGPEAVEVLGPLPSRRFHGGQRAAISLVVKTTDRDAAQQFLWPLVTASHMPADVRLTVDVDPLEL